MEYTTIKRYKRCAEFICKNRGFEVKKRGFEVIIIIMIIIINKNNLRRRRRRRTSFDDELC